MHFLTKKVHRETVFAFKKRMRRTSERLLTLYKSISCQRLSYGACWDKLSKRVRKAPRKGFFLSRATTSLVKRNNSKNQSEAQRKGS
jgi:hypothetical protein